MLPQATELHYGNWRKTLKDTPMSVIEMWINPSIQPPAYKTQNSRKFALLLTPEVKAKKQPDSTWCVVDMYGNHLTPNCESKALAWDIAIGIAYHLLERLKYRPTLN